MPFLVNSGGEDTTQYRNWLGTESTTPALTREQFDTIGTKIFRDVNQSDFGLGFWERQGRWAAGTGIDLIDTVASSPLVPTNMVPLSPHINRGDVWNLASPEEKDYYQRHKDLIEGSSAIVGGIATAVGAEALVIPRLTEGLMSSTVLSNSRIVTAASRWNAASREGMMIAQRTAAENGTAFGLISTKAGQKYLLNRAVAGAATALRTAPLEYGVMWNNEAFNSGDWSKEGFWIGVGAVFGGTLGVIGGRSVVRKTANLAEIKDVRSAPFSLAGVSNDLLGTDHLELAKRLNPDAVALKESAYTTEFLLGSRSANPSGLAEAPANATRLSKLRDEHTQYAVDSLQKIVSKGVAGTGTGIDRSAVKNLPEIRYIVNDVAKDDPFTLHGLGEMGVVKGNIDLVRADRVSYLESLRKQADIFAGKGNLKEEARLRRLHSKLKNQDEFAMIGGTWMSPDSLLVKAAALHDPKIVEAKFISNQKGTEGIKMTGFGRSFALDGSLTPRDHATGAVIHPESLPSRDRMVLDEGSNIIVKRMLNPTTTTKFVLTDKAAENWYTLDLAAEILGQGGKIEFAKDMTKKIRTLDDIRRESLRIKAKAILSRMPQIGQGSRITTEMRYRYNLPLPTSMEQLEDSAGDGFRKWLYGATKDEGTANEMADALTTSRSLQGVDLLPGTGTPYARLDGDMLRFNRNADGKWMRPLLGYFDRRSNIQALSQRGYANALTLRKAEKTAVLLGGQTHVSALAQRLVASPELIPAMDVAGLHADQITGLGGGLKQLLGETLPKRFRFRDDQTMLNATKIQEAAERHGLSQFKSMMDDVGMQADVTRITSSGNAHQRVALDQYFSLRSGWDVDAATLIEKDKYGFRLKDTPANRSRLGYTPEQKWDFPFLKNQRLNKEIIVDPESLDVINKFNKLTDAIREADNTLRHAKGLDAVDHKGFYTPPPQTRNALVGFVFDPKGKVVNGKTIVARSQEEYNQMLNRTLKDLGPNSGHTIRSREQIESLRDIWDEAQMDWIDPGVHAGTAGIGAQTGGLSGAYVKQGSFMEALDWIKRKTVAQSQDTVRQLMDEPILVARARGAAEAAATPSVGKTRTIFDEYEMALTGKSQNYFDTSLTDGTLRKIEESINKVLANSALTVPARHIVDLAQRIGMNPLDISGKKTFGDISKAMGKYTPFENATEFVESRGIRRPPTVKGMAGVQNSLAASVMLRWFELPHSLMNLFGLIATVPPTVLAGSAPVSTFVDVAGRRIGFFDGTKIMANAMKDMFTKRGSRDWDHMRAVGDAGQSVIDYHQQLGAVNSQAGFMKWAKGADKWASILTDTSENWSRQYAHFVGLRMADHMGLTNMVGRHDFAREIANAAIADYAPINRPELFSSGFGSMIGLFQAYAFNHYTKMFRWMENGDYAKAGFQASLQATMFGLPGTYGLGSLLDLRDSLLSTGSDPTAVDLIYEHFGPVLGGAIVHGGISELTQLALWSRGDMTPRIPGQSGNLPAIDVGVKVATGFVDATRAYLSAMPGEGTHAVIEAVQREMPNRVMKSWLALLNGGKEIDARGQVMSETKTWLDTIARTVGVRSRRQQAELEAFYAGKGAMERDAVKMEVLRESFRSAVRSNHGNIEGVNPVQYFNKYVQAGGNPRQFRTWAKNLLRDSDSSRSTQQLKRELTTPRTALETWRYGAYGAWDINE
jgi:hypothetical protein